LVLGALAARQLLGKARTQLILELFEPHASQRMHQPGLQVAAGRRARRAIENVAHDGERHGSGQERPA